MSIAVPLADTSDATPPDIITLPVLPPIIPLPVGPVVSLPAETPVIPDLPTIIGLPDLPIVDPIVDPPDSLDRIDVPMPVLGKPQFDYAYRFGSSSYDSVHGVTTDSWGNVYTVGNFQGTVDFDPGPDTFFLTSSGGAHAFILKLDSEGNFVWARQLAGTIMNGFDVAVDAWGDVYATGTFYDATDFDPGAGTFFLSPQGNNEDVFVLKLDNNGNFVWARQLGGPGRAFADHIAVDEWGNVYTSGEFDDTVDFDPGEGVLTLTSAGLRDVYISKLDTNGNFLWARRLGSSNQYNWLTGIAVDRSGNVFLNGFLHGATDIDNGSSATPLPGNKGFWAGLLKLNANGDCVWVREHGGGINAGGPIAVDGAGNVYAATVNRKVEKFDNDGNPIWVYQPEEGGGYFMPQDFALDRWGNLYITGSFKGTVDFDPDLMNASLTSAGDLDNFVLKLNPAGKFVWASGMGGKNNDGRGKIAVDPAGNVYLAAPFVGTVDFGAGPGKTSLTSAGNAGFSDAFLLKLTQGGVLPPVVPPVVPPVIPPIVPPVVPPVVIPPVIGIPELPAVDPIIVLPEIPELPVVDPVIVLPEIPELPVIDPIIVLPEIPELPVVDPIIELPDIPELPIIDPPVVVEPIGFLDIPDNAFWSSYGWDPITKPFWYLTIVRDKLPMDLRILDFGNLQINGHVITLDVTVGPAALGLPEEVNQHVSSQPILPEFGTYTVLLNINGVPYKQATIEVTFGMNANGRGVDYTAPVPGVGSPIGSPIVVPVPALPPVVPPVVEPPVFGDPKFGFANRFGSAFFTDVGYDVITDRWGNVYTIGSFAGTVDFDPGAGIFNLTSAGLFDVFLTKLDRDGNFLWARRFGGSLDDFGTAIAIDDAGGVYTLRNTVLNTYPGVGVGFAAIWRAFQVVNSTVSKLDTNGNPLWEHTVTDATNRTSFQDIALAPSGGVYITGSSGGMDFDPGAGEYHLQENVGAFLWNLDAVGNFVCASRLDGDTGYNVAVDSRGNVLTTSVNQVTGDTTVTKTDPAGNTLWARGLANGWGYTEAIAVDDAGSVYIAGEFSRITDFDPGPGTWSRTPEGGSDAFLWKLDANGQFVRALRYLGQDRSSVTDIATDHAGGVYLTGSFYGSRNYIDAHDTVTRITSAGDADMYIEKLDSDCNTLWTVRMGGTSWDRAQAISVDDEGNIHTTGFFQGTADFDPGLGAANRTSAGGCDVMTVKLTQPFTLPTVVVPPVLVTVPIVTVPHVTLPPVVTPPVILPPVVTPPVIPTPPVIQPPVVNPPVILLPVIPPHVIKLPYIPGLTIIDDDYYLITFPVLPPVISLPIVPPVVTPLVIGIPELPGITPVTNTFLHALLGAFAGLTPTTTAPEEPSADPNAPTLNSLLESETETPAQSGVEGPAPDQPDSVDPLIRLV